MSDELVRFGVAMESGLLTALDQLVTTRSATRSRLLSDLARAEVAKNQLTPGVPAVGALTLVYDHHVRDLTERLTELQHELGDSVRSSLHVHLNHDECLEVIVLRGQSDTLQAISAKILAMRGVNHGELVLVPERPGAATHTHHHAHGPGVVHSHAAQTRLLTAPLRGKKAASTKAAASPRGQAEPVRIGARVQGKLAPRPRRKS